MGTGLLSKLLGSLKTIGEQIPDVRRAGGSLKYRLFDGSKSAFAVFFFLYPFQRPMKKRRKRNNMETLSALTAIPGDNRIRTLPDMEGKLRIAAQTPPFTFYPFRHILYSELIPKPGILGLASGKAVKARFSR
ncbi:MAG: hypothetical protein LBE10_05825 [Treponema sp.]|jgi:hypothetical protein|nr:hypothetical protein [Treponema sp.]